MKPAAVAVALIVREGRLFLQRRDPQATAFPGLWELPGGKLEPGEAPEGALRRELEEELRWTPELVVALEPLDFAYPDRKVRLHGFRCEGPGALLSPLAWGWFQRKESLRLPLPAATRALLETLGD